MSDDPRERVIDALLEELLSDVRPPDLTKRILDAQEASTPNSIDVRLVKASSPSVDEQTLPKVCSLPTKRKASNKSVVNRSKWNGWASAAIVLIAAAAFSYWAIRFSHDQDENNRSPIATIQHPAATDATAQLSGDLPNKSMPSQPKVLVPQANPSQTAAVVPQSSSPGDSIDFVVPPAFKRTVKLEEPSSDERIVAFVDRQLERTWKDESVPAMGPVDESVWFRRTCHFLLGREPNEREKNEFSRNRDREDAIDDLMVKKEFAQHWSSVFTDVLVGSARQNDQKFDREQLRKYLAQSIGADKPYDQLAYELITAVGSNAGDEADFNPATNFLLAHQGVERVDGKRDPSKKIVATDKVCQVFLGQQMQCAQCHDHTSVKRTQDQYYQMASFFAQMRPTWPGGPDSGVGRLINNDFRGSDRTFENADVFFNRPRQTGVSVYPQFLDGRALESKSGLIRIVDRRTELANMIVSSDDFSRAIINRLWDVAFKSGFTRPVDNMGSHNPPTHPELLDRLATEFKNTKYDTKSALRWITRSRAFSLRERPLHDPRAGQPDLFSSFARWNVHQNKAIGNSFQRVATARSEDGDNIDRLVVLGNQLGPGGTMSPDEKTRQIQDNNSKLSEHVLSKEDGGMVSRIARNESMSEADKVTHMFLATVGRRPREFELKQGVEILKHGTTISALRDVGLVLLGSEEYLIQH